MIFFNATVRILSKFRKIEPLHAPQGGNVSGSNVLESLNLKKKWLKGLNKESIMKKIAKNTAIVLIGILSISLVAGNVLFAGNQGIITNDDAAIASSGFSAGSGSGRDSQASSDVITAEDSKFAASSYNGSLVASGSSGSGSSQSVVNMNDISFVRNGGSGTANLVCVVDGSQVSGKVCVN